MIDRICFLDWCESRFPGEYKESGDEIKINSPFDPNKDDVKHKLWCNPTGGKDERDDGVFHCWISNAKGSLITLVMRIDGVDYETACQTLDGGISIPVLERQLQEVFIKKPDIDTIKTPIPLGLTMPEGVYSFLEIPQYNKFRVRAEKYLNGRKIPSEEFFLGVSGDYKDRIIIPYYDRKGQLIYYNGRHLWREDPKYLGPPKELGIGKGDLVYMPKWSPIKSTLYVTEGEFDAYVLYLCGLNAASVGGSNLTWNQIKILRDYQLVIAVDNDSAGFTALNKIITGLKDYAINKVRYVRQPVGIKDWNEFYIKHGKEVVLKYATEKAKIFPIALN